jgi:hypothetical protein
MRDFFLDVSGRVESHAVARKRKSKPYKTGHSMGDLINLEEARKSKQGVFVTTDFKFTFTPSSIEIHAYNLWNACTILLQMLHDGVRFDPQVVTLRVVPLPPLLPAPAPAPVTLVASQPAVRLSFWSRLKQVWRKFRPNIRSI